MAVAQIEQRVAAPEAEVSRLKEKLEAVTKRARPWWQEIYGTFADDPLHEEAMQAGREYRESLRPRARAANQTIKQTKEVIRCSSCSTLTT